MPRPTMIDLSADAIGQTWTMELHQTLVAHLRQVDRLAQDVIAQREREHNSALVAARGEIAERAARREARMWGEGPAYHHSLIDPEAAEI